MQADFTRSRAVLLRPISPPSRLANGQQPPAQHKAAQWRSCRGTKQEDLLVLLPAETACCVCCSYCVLTTGLLSPCLQHLAAFEDPKAVASRHRWFPQFLAALLKVRSSPQRLPMFSPPTAAEPVAAAGVTEAQQQPLPAAESCSRATPCNSLGASLVDAFVSVGLICGVARRIHSMYG